MKLPESDRFRESLFFTLNPGLIENPGFFGQRYCACVLTVASCMIEPSGFNTRTLKPQSPSP